MPKPLLVFVLATVPSAHAAPVAEATQLVGSWNVTLSANYSTCDNVKRGDVSAQQWVVSVSSGALAVQVLGAANTSAAYVGLVKDNKVVLMAKSARTYATVELTGDTAALRGRRVVANSNPCAIIYDVEAKKQQ